MLLEESLGNRKAEIYRAENGCGRCRLLQGNFFGKAGSIGI